MTKAQITVEYLLLSSIALVLISFSIIALANIKDRSEKAYDATLFKSSVSELANSIEEVCALGNGNGQAAYLKRNMSIEGGASSSGFYAVFTDAVSGLSIVEKTYCEVDGLSDAYGKTEVENKNGKIIVRKA